MKPAPMPLVIEYVNGISTIVRKHGIAIAQSSHGMPLTCVNGRKPTATSAGVAAADGTIEYSGVKNSAITKNSPVKMLAMPVRAPSPTPAADSMNAVFDETEP